MTSFAIIAETAPKVNVKPEDNGAFNSLVEKNTPSTVAASHCETYDPDPYATNSFPFARMSFERHGDDVASFDDKLNALIERNSTTKQATLQHLDQLTTRYTMCARHAR